jgi:hypothetical protein
MSTAEDVFYLYERNSRIYHDYSDYEDCVNKTCNCYINKVVRPLTIGDQDTPCNIKYRCYIRPGTECPICYEQILTKSSAFITNCGHHFHKKCLFKYIENKRLDTSYMNVVKCPICRCSIGYPEFVQRYRSSYYSYNNLHDENQLDKLEDFWLCQDYKLPDFCDNGYNHYLGLNSNCFVCKHYRNKGQLC